MSVLVLSEFLHVVFINECLQVFDVTYLSISLGFVLFLKVNFFLADFFKFVLQVLKLLLFLKVGFVSDVILLSECFKSSTYFFLLFTTGFPVRNKVIWLKQCISLHVCNFSFFLFTLRNCVFIFEFLHNGSNISSCGPLLHKVISLRFIQQPLISV